VRILLQESPRISILGTGGMGKTSLAIAALHDPDVSSKYAERYFIGCHSSPTCTELLSSIATHIGIDKGIRL
jgi:GTPase SAR1 family protein